MKHTNWRILGLCLLVIAFGAAGCEHADDDDDASSEEAESEFLESNAELAAAEGSEAGEAAGASGGAFADHVGDLKAKYGKSDEWEDWMLANSGRYAATFGMTRGSPASVSISFQYETKPLNYSPAWSSEAEHMAALKRMAEGAYPGYSFSFNYGGRAAGVSANVVAGTAGTTSYASGSTVYLYYETIFNHEFAHVMKLPHHYGSSGDTGGGSHMPPGESKCLMDRNSSLFCSGCKAALGIPLDANSSSAVDSAIRDILSRYPSSGEPRYMDSDTGGDTGTTGGDTGGGTGPVDDDDSGGGGGLIYGLKQR